MAFFDDRKFILFYIRNAFIAAESGSYRESLIDDALSQSHNVFDEVDDVTRNLLNEIHQDDYLLVEPVESLSPRGYARNRGGFRRRTGTDARLAKMKEEMDKRKKQNLIPWKDCDKSSQFSQEELDSFFSSNAVKFPGRKIGSPEEAERYPDTGHISSLSAQLDEFAKIAPNPFADYSRFDRRDVQLLLSEEVKRLHIFTPVEMAIDWRNNPLLVTVSKTTSVGDLIGLICWQYTSETRSPQLESNIHNYCLMIAEKNGDCDEDLPSLNRHDWIMKFGFPYLALKEVKPISKVESRKSFIGFD